MLPAALIIPVHNRRETTAACLQRLAEQKVLEWATPWVIDGGSTDGTAAAVSTRFPQARIVHGSGDLWWTGAVAAGMRSAYDAGAEFIFWLNDDTLPAPGACRRLMDTAARTGAMVTGQSYIDPPGVLVYGGLDRRRVSLRLVEAQPRELRQVDACAGNFVCMPRGVVERVGWPDATRFPHAHGDTDYALRARRMGYEVIIDGDARAAATPNAWSNYASWLLSEISVADLWRNLGDRRSYAYAPAHLRWMVRHFGTAGAAYWIWTVCKRVPISVLRLTVPQSALRRIWGHRSRAWQEERRLRTAAALNSPASDEAAADEKRTR